MNEIQEQQKREQYLNRIDQIYEELQAHTDKFLHDHKKIRNKLAKTIEEAKLESDLGLSDISRHTGKSRQAIHKFVKEAYGVRHADKSEAAKKGHIYKR